MALQPQYQSLTERKMVRATHGVITNARPDHLDVMGPTPRDVALALAGSVPSNAKLFTAEQRQLDIFQAAAADRGSEVVTSTPADAAGITEEDLAQFAYAEHAENVALALKVCADLGIDRAVALGGMQSLEPEVGATQVQDINFHGRDIIFVNGFAANDPESTAMIWERMVARHGEDRRCIALVNCRADRPQRSQQLADIAANWSTADHYVLIGSGTLLFARRAVRNGIPPDRMTVYEGLPTAELFERVLEHGGERCLVVGMCNVHGGGEDLARYFSNRAHRSRPL
jgi:poly-gamma-glutamate synthase PgsB/CapB